MRAGPVNGSVVINDSDGFGNFDAEGDIQVGQPVRPPVPVTFDGSIMVKGAGTGFFGGDLFGDITVSGCHATTDALDICVCGTTVGSIAISQNNCTNQVVDSCVSGCP